MTDYQDQDVIAGKLALLALVDDLKRVKDNYNSIRELARAFGRKDSDLSQLTTKLLDAVEHIRGLEGATARAVSTSPSVEDGELIEENIPQRKFSIHHAIQCLRLTPKIEPIETEDTRDPGQLTEEIEIIKVVKLREADSDQTHCQQSDRFSSKHENCPKESSSGFRRTPPTAPRAMIECRENGNAAAHSRSDNIESQKIKRRRNSSTGSNRARCGSPPPSQTQTRLSRAQHSYESYRMTSFGTSRTSSWRIRPSFPGYGDPNRPLPKNTERDSRSSGKR